MISRGQRLRLFGAVAFPIAAIAIGLVVGSITGRLPTDVLRGEFGAANAAKAVIGIVALMAWLVMFTIPAMRALRAESLDPLPSSFRAHLEKFGGQQ